jgi:hypothetical protein
LEGDDGCGHDGQPNERECRLAAGKAGVEEAAVCQLRHLLRAARQGYPTPGIMSSTKAVDVIIQAISPDCAERQFRFSCGISVFISPGSRC